MFYKFGEGGVLLRWTKVWSSVHREQRICRLRCEHAASAHQIYFVHLPKYLPGEALRVAPAGCIIRVGNFVAVVGVRPEHRLFERLPYESSAVPRRHEVK